MDGNVGIEHPFAILGLRAFSADEQFATWSTWHIGGELGGAVGVNQTPTEVTVITII